jgi:hypothetical protein
MHLYKPMPSSKVIAKAEEWRNSDWDKEGWDFHGGSNFMAERAFSLSVVE